MTQVATAPAVSAAPVRRRGPEHPSYKWLALSNTTLGVLMATVNSSIVLISLPAIFRGIGINPLQPGNISYLLWMIMGYMLVTAVLVVTLGRLGDMYGRARIYNAGFAVFTVASVLLALDPFTGGGGALWLIGIRVLQGIGGAMLMANSTAILTDAFPAERRGFAIGTNSVAAIGGSFIGLLVGGLLSEVDWRLVFWVSVPFGVVGTVWAYLTLRDPAGRRRHRIDWWGNVSFGLGLILLLVGVSTRSTDFDYRVFAAVLLVNGIGSGLFISPNMTGIMNSLPADQRGAGSGMMSTLQNSGMALSIGVFFSMLIAGLASSMPPALFAGLTGQGVPAPVAQGVADLPPVGTLFAAFLGYNPMQEILGPTVLGALAPGSAATLVGTQFFPDLVTGAFHDGLVVVFAVAIAVSLVGAVASLFRGGHYVHQDVPQAVRVEPAAGDPAGPALPAPTVTGHGSGPAATGCTVRGRVIDEAGRPVRATVTLTDVNGVQLGHGASDAEGGFALAGRPGPALLIASAPGHRPSADMTRLSPGDARVAVVLAST